MDQFLKDLFLNVLKMSITASYVIFFVLFARMLLKKSPKIFSYCLWAVVLFRLVCPFSFPSTLSFLGFLKTKNVEIIPANIGLMTQPQVIAGINDMNQAVNSYLPAVKPIASADPMQTVLLIISLLWALGILSLLIYSVVSYLQLKRKVSMAMLLNDNILECENIKSPFVLGIIKPKIYLPIGFSEKEKSYILKHEETHIKRFDYIVKPFAFLVLCIHWFNPLVWIGFILMNRDMEMSCDEHVLKEMGTDIKKDYSSSLLSLAVDRKIISGSPLAFGESNTKGRIKNVLNYKKPAFWMVIAAVLGIAVISVGLMANPKKDKPGMSLIDINSTISSAKQKADLLIRGHSFGASVVTGNEFGLWLEDASKNWKIVNTLSPYGLLPTLTVYINIGTGHEVSFYKSEQEFASISYDGKNQYYSISEDDYNKIFMMFAIRNYIIPDEAVSAITDGKRTNMQSVQDIPNSGDCKELKVGKDSYFLYENNGKYYCEQPYVFINEITEESYKNAVEFAGTQKQESNPEVSSEIKSLVEENLSTITSSPLQSSNPEDYIRANDKAYEDILKYGGEEALAYMLSQFEQGNADGLRGQIMMRICKEILGVRNNVSDETLSPMEWYSKLVIRQKVDVPDFVYRGNDPIEKLVYETEVQKHESRGGFTIVAPHIFGSYEEKNKLKVFVTTFGSHYILYSKTLSDEGGEIVPAAITYSKNPDGSYTLEKYEQAKDGSYFGPSIKEFCVMPVSGKTISGLYEKILNHYGNYKDILELERENLAEHLKANNLYGVFLNQKNYQKPEELIPIT